VAQLDLFGEPEASPAPAPDPAFKQTRSDRLLEALKRDLATLAGPPEYIAGGDRAFYEERVASYRAMLLSVVD
jgi:hypothetical protein